MDYSKYTNLQVTRNGKVLEIAFNRPEVKNAVNAGVHAELVSIFPEVNKDDETEIVILTGKGGAFSAGGDLEMLLKDHGDPVATSKAIHQDRILQHAILDLEKPIIAKVNGPAVGLGCSLALFCDFVFATPDSQFADPHVSVGLVAGDGGAYLWPMLIGYARARKYLLTGAFVDGKTAAEIGLITDVVAEDALDETVDKLVKRLLNTPKYALKWTKASINAGLKVTANAVIDLSAAYENVSMFTEDHKIAVEAMMSRTKPKFTGR